MPPPWKYLLSGQIKGRKIQHGRNAAYILGTARYRAFACFTGIASHLPHLF
jgi:hypothetical protein